MALISRPKRWNGFSRLTHGIGSPYWRAMVTGDVYDEVEQRLRNAAAQENRECELLVLPSAVGAPDGYVGSVHLTTYKMRRFLTQQVFFDGPRRAAGREP